jgi:hypothetical protein
MVPRLARPGGQRGRYKRLPKELSSLQKKALRILLEAGMPASEARVALNIPRAQMMREFESAKQDS